MRLGDRSVATSISSWRIRSWARPRSLRSASSRYARWTCSIRTPTTVRAPAASHAEVARARLVVDRHAQRLERARGDVEAAGPRRAGHRAADRCHEVARPRQGPAADDRPRDAPRVRLLAVLENDARELRLGEPVRERGCARVGRRVQAHVEGLVLLEGESPSRLFELPGGKAGVKVARAGAGDTPSAG